MNSPVISVTIQAMLITATSNILAQAITAYRTDSPFSITWRPVFEFIFYSALSCPPNFLLQQYLEHFLPGQTLSPSKDGIAVAALEKTPSSTDQDDLPNKALVETHLNITNTVLKFFVDQTVSATLNTLGFSLTMAALHGANLEQSMQIAKQDFWPMVYAGWRLWPAVSLCNYAFIKTVEMRTLIGNLAGVVWNVYLSLVQSGK